MLDANNVPYEVLEYDSSIKDAQHAAEMVGMPPGLWFYKRSLAQSVKTALCHSLL
ncbi:MAG: hypothetical protein Q9P01_09030 [Anaerolineae bacterium]|nr:hypothetical protein [Anaerolineae bacterium]